MLLNYLFIDTHNTQTQIAPKQNLRVFFSVHLLCLCNPFSLIYPSLKIVIRLRSYETNCTTYAKIYVVIDLSIIV